MFEDYRYIAGSRPAPRFGGMTPDFWYEVISWDEQKKTGVVRQHREKVACDKNMRDIDICLVEKVSAG